MKKGLLLVCCLLVVGMLAPVYASELSNKKSELNSAQQDIKNSKAELEVTQAQQEKVSQEIDQLDISITKIEDEILQIEDQLEKKKEEVVLAQTELERATEKKDIQYESTKDRMVQMYKNSKVGFLGIIFSADDIWDMLNRAKYVQTISKYDKQLLSEYQEQEEVIAEKKSNLEQEQKNVENLYAAQVSKKSELDSVRKEKNTKLGVLKTQETALYAQIDELEKVSKELETEIKKLTAKSTIKYNGGKFAWPVPNYYRLSSEYNPRENPISGKNEFHQGIDIPAPYGKAVVAAADGVVITAGWVRGFGNTVMIDHGSGIVSIYGHNSSLTVSTGQKISKGQQVARIGSTGYSTGNHCHFEVRVNGVHTNPWKYLNK